MNRLFLIAVFLTLSLLKPSAAQDLRTGIGLLNTCSSQLKAGDALCKIYFEAFITGFVLSSDLTPGAVCLTREATFDDIKSVSIKYMKDHPETLHLGAAGPIAKALIEAYPCTRKHQ